MSSRSLLAGEIPLEASVRVPHAETARLERRVTEAFHRFREPVYNYVLVIVSEPAEAEDVTQEAFLRYFQQLQQGRPVRNPKAWLFRVAHNVALNRQRDRAKLDHLQDEDGPQCRGDSSQIHERLVEEEQRARVTSSLSRLSAQERRCIELRAEGLLYREIAEVLSIRVSSVSNYVHRAVQKMAEAMRP